MNLPSLALALVIVATCNKLAYSNEVSPLYYPELLASWEVVEDNDSIEGWSDIFPADRDDFDDVLSLSQVGVTSGEYSLAITTSGAGDHLAARVFWDVWECDASYTTIRNALQNPDLYELELDITYESADLPDDFAFMFVSLAAFTCLGDACEDPTWVQSDPLATINGFSVPESTQHVSVPFSRFADLSKQADWYEFHLLHSNDWSTDGTYYVDNFRLSSTLSGDLNNDGTISASDMDALSVLVKNPSPFVAQFDVNEDGVLSELDRLAWMTLMGTTPGDADLNGIVDFTDFLALSASFGQEAGWVAGDFDGDSLVGFSDFLLLSDNFGGANRIQPVPEPIAMPGLILVATLLVARQPKRQH